MDGIISDVAFYKNLAELTDWKTDEIFDVQGIKQIVFPYSRLICDVERLPDEDEPQFKNGRGFYYTHGYDGKQFKTVSARAKSFIFNKIYTSHHDTLFRETKERLEKHNTCTIIDCHSFNDTPLGVNVEHPISPDICIGVDEFHTSKITEDYFVRCFTNLGYSVAINNPYSGCIIPMEFYKKDKRVEGIMIEINKRLYMKPDGTYTNIEKLNKEISDIVLNIL